MRPIINFLESIVDHVIANPSATKAQVASKVTSATNGVSNPEAKQYLDDIGAVYAGVGIISDPTFESWRDDVIAKGPVVAKNLVSAMVSNLSNSDDLKPVNQDLHLKAQDDFKVQIALDITAVEAARDAAADPAIKRALNAGVADLNFSLQTGRRRRKD